MVSIINLHRRYRVNEKMAGRLVRKILRRLKKPASTDIEVVFLDDRAMRKMSRIYKKHDRFTDVLSFRLNGKEFGVRKFIGEILISVDRAKANGVFFGRPLAEEIVRYLAHGILHFFGYDDQKPSDRKKMSESEDRILEHLCAKEDLSKVLTRR